MAIQTIFYKREVIWCPYPWQDEIDEQFVNFYKRVKKKYILIPGLQMETNTSIKEKEEYIKEKLNLSKVKILKLK